MRGSKAGFGDLKRLREQAQALGRQEEEAAAARRAAAGGTAQQAREQGKAAAGATHDQARGKATLPRGNRLDDDADFPPQRTAAPPSDPADDLRAFQKAMGTVTPLRAEARVIHTHRPDPTDIPVQRRAAALGETARRADAGVSDGGVAHLLSENGTAYVRADAAPDTARKLRRGEWQAGAELDLHGLRVEQARHAVLSFIDECLEHGIRCVRVVHGKGYGSEGLSPVLKDKARTWLAQRPEVIAFSEAPPREGGSGALLVLLRQLEDARR
ncbi:Putative DNA endonuclease SmrA [Bordetella sputigena]|uniref:Smr/MutS family protein n=1 Tax=Bordetella sputigena TaxID=1416810 RepID=UPI0039F0C174